MSKQKVCIGKFVSLCLVASSKSEPAKRGQRKVASKQTVEPLVMNAASPKRKGRESFDGEVPPGKLTEVIQRNKMFS